VVGPGGDEPHYLVIAQSLLADHDLRVANNYAPEQYHKFFGGILRPDYMRPGANGQIYSIHAPGLPALLLPAYALGGYFGAVAMMCLIAALTALAVFDLARALAGPRAAVITWLAVCFTVPFIPEAWLLFPEGPGALAVAWAALWIWSEPDRRAAVWAWRGIVLALLPWMHTKFIVFTAALGAALLVRIWRNVRASAALAVPIALSVAAWLLSFYVLYGEFDPEAPYGDYVRINVLMKNIPRGLLGLMFDQKFGLLFYSPIYLVAVAGAWMMFRRSGTRYLALVLTGVTALFVASTTRLYMWWGGSSAPARFLVPILPCLAPMLAVAVAEARAAAARTLVWLWLGIGLAIGALGAIWPERFLLFSEPHGWARLLETIQAGSPLARSFPTFTNEDWQRPLRELAPWFAAAVAGLGAIVAAARWKTLRPLWVGVLGSVVFLFTAGVATGRASAEVREDTARRGALDLLWNYDGGRLRSLEYDTLRRADAARVLQIGAFSTRVPQGGVPITTVGPFALPPGTYEARVWHTGASQGEFVVAAANGAEFRRSAVGRENPTVFTFELPVEIAHVIVKAPDRSVVISQVDVAPLSIVPVSLRPDTPTRAIEALGRPGAYLVYGDDQSFPEGGVFWTRGTEPANVLVAPGGASRLRLTLHLGPRSGRVQLTIAGEERPVDVQANATTQVAVDVPQGVRLVPIRVQSPVWFRPSDVDHATDDTRSLGCQVRVDVE
jgi:hypothetical protein